MSKYGLPYMGSKDKICENLIKIFPKAKNFYDVFGGGFSVTHAMLVKRKSHYENFYFNEIRSGICEMIQDSISGKYSYENFKPEWISREKFNKQKEKNAYIKICWSFGNNGKTYIFGKDIEKYKRSMHQAIVFNEFNDLAKAVFGMDSFKESYDIKQKRSFLRNRIDYFRVYKKYPKEIFKFLTEDQRKEVEHHKQLEQLQQLQRLERLQRLEQLEQLPENLHFTNLDYRKVKIKPDSVVYCDPPYIGTASYDGGFNHKEFYDWANSQKNPVFISEYKLEDDRFRQVWSVKKISLLAPDKSVGKKIEKVFANKAALKSIGLSNGR